MRKMMSLKAHAVVLVKANTPFEEQPGGAVGGWRDWAHWYASQLGTTALCLMTHAGRASTCRLLVV